jgi:hypothetical protein
MKIDTTVTKGTVPGVMPVLTESKVIIKPAGVSDGIIESGGSLPLSEFFLGIDNFFFCKRIIGIAVDAPVDSGIELALFDLFGDFYVVHVLLFGELLFEDELLGGVGLLGGGEGGGLGCGVVEGFEFVVELGLLLGVVLCCAVGD